MNKTEVLMLLGAFLIGFGLGGIYVIKQFQISGELEGCYFFEEEVR